MEINLLNKSQEPPGPLLPPQGSRCGDVSMLKNITKHFKVQSVLNFQQTSTQTGCRLEGVWFWIRGEKLPKKGATLRIL